MKRVMFTAGIVAAVVWSGPALLAFCGFYVAKADTKLFNRASSVILVREGDRTVLTMSNDFSGDVKDFAVVIPVPTVIERESVRVADRALVQHVDAYSAPRLVEYFDTNPCAPILELRAASPTAAAGRGGAAGAGPRQTSLGVTIEAQYTVGEYDILILSATQSTGLETWLRENGYRIPAGASAVLASYIRQNMKFFVAKVNLTEQNKLGYSMLRPIQVEYTSPKFMLPIRLGMVNADGPQELFVFALTHEGRVETTNYRTVKLPTGMTIPLYVKDRFGDFYKSMFSEAVRKEDMSTVFTEYAWDMGSCDPCSAEPLSNDELKRLGMTVGDGGGAQPAGRGQVVRPRFGQAFITRLHVRYDNAHFPEDLVFQTTADRSSFQGRYVLQHEWTGSDSCAAADRYREELPRRRDEWARNLALLTGWDINQIRRDMRGGQ